MLRAFEITGRKTEEGREERREEEGAEGGKGGGWRDGGARKEAQ